MKFTKSCVKVWGIEKVELKSITRAHLISKANVSDIKKQMKYSRMFHFEDSTSIHLIVKMLQLESYNFIIVYKPQGQPVETGSSIFNDINAKKDLFALGIQTKKQFEMSK